jgi:hypothetical protein
LDSTLSTAWVRWGVVRRRHPLASMNRWACVTVSRTAIQLARPPRERTTTNPLNPIYPMNYVVSQTVVPCLARSLSLSLSLSHSLGHPHPHPHPPAHRLYFCVFAGAGCGGPSPGLSPAQINTDVVYRLVEQDMEPMTGGESHTPRLAMSWRVEVLPYHRTAPQPLPHLTRRIAPANGVLTPARDHRCSVRCA